MLNVNNMADAGQICNIAYLHVVTDFLFQEEGESLVEGNHEDTFVMLSSCCVFNSLNTFRFIFSLRGSAMKRNISVTYWCFEKGCLTNGEKLTRQCGKL